MACTGQNDGTACSPSGGGHSIQDCKVTCAIFITLRAIDFEEVDGESFNSKQIENQITFLEYSSRIYRSELRRVFKNINKSFMVQIISYRPSSLLGVILSILLIYTVGACQKRTEDVSFGRETETLKIDERCLLRIVSSIAQDKIRPLHFFFFFQ